MLSPGDRLGVAVSGGVDSVTLLHLLSALSGRLSCSLFVLHVNHQLRGEESAGDEEFVRALAESLGLPSEVSCLALGPGNLEQEARIARRRFFREARERHGLRWVALGHSRSDQAETVLFRMLRGSGMAGLAGMRMVTSDGLIRPLLTTSRREIREWALERGIEWREDSSNQNLHFRRNRLRHQTLPSLTAHYNNNLEGVLAGVAQVAQAEEEYWSERIEAIYGRITKRTPLASFLQIRDLMALHPAERRRLVRRALREIKGDLRSIDLEHVEGVLAICNSSHGHHRLVVPGVDVLRSFDTLRLTGAERAKGEERDYRVPAQFGQWQTLPFGAGRIAVNWGDSEPQNCVNFNKAEDVFSGTVKLEGGMLSPAEQESLLYVRNWQPGDEIELPGQTAKKLKFLFQEQRVLLWERKHWPVMVFGDRIVWTRQFGCAADGRESGKGDSGESLRTLHIYYCAGL